MYNLTQKKVAGGWVFAHRTCVGADQTSDMGPPSHSPPTGGFRRWFGWQSWAPMTQSQDSDSGHGDLECHLTGGEEALPAQDCRAHLHAQSVLWKPTPWERLDSRLLWSCPQWQAGPVGLLIAPQLSRHVLEFSLVRTLPQGGRAGLGSSPLMIGWGAQSRATASPHWEEPAEMAICPGAICMGWPLDVSLGRCSRHVWPRGMNQCHDSSIIFLNCHFYVTAMQWWKLLVILVSFSLWSLFPFGSSDVRLHTIYC